MIIGQPHLRARLLAVAIMVLVVPSLSAVRAGERQSSSTTGDWYQIYTRGRDDIKKEAYEEAEKKLLQARKSGPAQGPRTLISGGLIVSFSPDYYLGEVYLKLGRTREALAAFDSASKQNLNTRSGEFVRLEEYRKSASTLDGLIQTAKADVTKGDLASARKNAEDARALGQNAVVDNLLAEIKVAEASAIAKNPPVPGGGATNPVAPGGVKDTAAPANPAPVNPEIVNPAPVATPPPAGGTTGGGASTAVAAAKPEEKAKDPAPTPPPVDPTRTESTAMRQFFNGDYEPAIATLARLNTPRALFYRACSRAAMALLSGSSDPAQLTTARQEYSRAVSGTADFRRDKPYISPGILQSLTEMSPLAVGQGYVGGTDYRRANGVASAADCSALCGREQVCVAMTFIISTNLCYLKDRVPASAATPDMISAVKVVK